jgi:hypothetical protein
MFLNQRLNRFEIAVYNNILDYWLEKSQGYINFESSEDKALVSEFALTEDEYYIIEKFYKKRLTS